MRNAKKAGNEREKELYDFSGRPVVKTLLSNTGGVGSILGWGAKILHASQPKSQNIKKKIRNNMVTEFNKDFKNAPRQKNSFKKKGKENNFRRKLQREQKS